MTKYSNTRATRALVKASLQSIFKSPSAIVFSIAFPLIFILIFGFLGGEGNYSIRVASAYGSDTTNELYSVLHNVSVLKWISKEDTTSLNKAVRDGDITATINIKKQAAGTTPQYKIELNASSEQEDKAGQLSSILQSVVQRMDPEIKKRTDEIANIDLQISKVRAYKTIDFILPGQLGFSMMAAGIFGTAFVFFNARQTLILKRFFATPVRREIIVISEGIARMLFQMMGAIVIIAIGYFAFGFTLIHGLLTIIEMIVVCMVGLMIAMGFGFIISSISKSESAIPPLANTIVMPQLLLAGTFFSVDAFPKWLQPICKALPLTYMNDALRKISFEGANLWTVRTDMLILIVWGIAVYFAASKLFKWE